MAHNSKREYGIVLRFVTIEGKCKSLEWQVVAVRCSYWPDCL
jgi:hypothetical protein